MSHTALDALVVWIVPTVTGLLIVWWDEHTRRKDRP